MLKIKELASYENTWRKYLSEKSQSEKKAYCMTPTICFSGKDITVDTIEGSFGWCTDHVTVHALMTWLIRH